MKRFAAACWLLLAAPLAYPASPDLTIVMPRGGQRGTEVVLSFAGANLADAKEILSEESGLVVTKIEPAPNLVKATVKIAPDCPLGEHGLRVRTATGVSPLRTFWVGALPIVDEKEPNNEFAKPQEIPINRTVHGVVTGEDVDHFAVEAKKGQRLTVEVEAMRLGGAFFDAHVSILDAKRFELASSDDTPLTTQDPCCSILVPADGKYVVRVRDSSYGGSPSHFYRLHVGTMPRPMQVIPGGGRPSEEVEFTFLGDPRGAVKRKIKLPGTPTDRFPLWLDDADGISPSPLPVRVFDAPNVAEKEPNDDPAKIPLADVPAAFGGVIDKPRDHDYFKFKAKAGQVFDVRCFARKLGSPLDPVVWVSIAGGRYLTGSDDAEGSPDSYFRFTAPEEKEYVIGVRDHLYHGGPLYAYRVEVTPVRPHTLTYLSAVELPPSQERMTVTVPKGNRAAVLLGVRRVDWGGAAVVEYHGLPDKVTAATPLDSARIGLTPLVLEAPADAPTGGRLVDIVAKPADAKLHFPGLFRQPLQLIVGQNQTFYHTYPAARLAVVVAEPAPFALKIIEPKAPLTRTGTMKLKVVAERKGTFKSPIRVQSVYNPPGVSAPYEVVMPEGQSEVVLPLTANGNAAAGVWPYVVTGLADGVRVAAAPANVTVAPPFVQLALDRGVIEQGKSGQVRGRVAVATPFTGPAKVRLVGLPPKIASPVVEITAESKEITFPLQVDPTCPPGPVKNLFCVIELTQAGEPVTHTAGATELRVDAPVAPKPSAAKVTAAPSKPAPKPADKPLSRLDQLRAQQAEKEKGAKP